MVNEGLSSNLTHIEWNDHFIIQTMTMNGWPGVGVELTLHWAEDIWGCEYEIQRQHTVM